MAEQFQLEWADNAFGSQADYVSSLLGPIATCHIWEMPDGSWQGGITWGKRMKDKKSNPLRSERPLSDRNEAKGWCEGRFLFVSSIGKKEPQ
jgi:hypothetical protein